jgi:hypothetical protein
MRGRRRFSWLGRAHLRPAMHGAEKGSVPQIITSEGAIRGHTAEQERNLPCCAPSCKPPGSPPRGLRLGAKLRSGQAGQAQVRGAKITDSVITGRPGTTAEYLGGYIRDAPA